MKVLFIGGTGVISSACSKLAIEKGIDLYHLNRGQTARHVPDGVKQLRGDIRDFQSVQSLLKDKMFDVVVDWIVYSPEQLETDLKLFSGRTGQYIFISTASAYQTPPAYLPVTESTPLNNAFWAYSQQKIACEDRLMRAFREDNFPMTIVRPSHTYDRTKLPVSGGWTTVNRMRRNKKIIVHGDGTSLWTLTHHADFAVGFVGLLGHPAAIGEAIHITSDEALTWNQIYTMVANAAGVDKPDMLHVPSEIINHFDKEWGAGLLGDKQHSMIFDNTKIKRFVPEFVAKIPFHQGVHEIVDWYDADPARQVIDDKLDQTMDRIVEVFSKLM
ncbi:NAD-dependent epimerase/dehydratase family protein [candidate division KSB1 bacterium]|nr:NAD-dependent epimerase/dehydratase family protein [candidate division KSB1 bacterium]